VRPRRRKRRLELPRRQFLEIAGLGTVALAVPGCGGGGDGGLDASADGDTWSDGDAPWTDADGPTVDGDLDGGDGDTLPDHNPAAEIDPITSNEDHYITSYAATPSVDGAAWRLVVDGSVVAGVEITLAELEALGALDRERTLMCIGSSPGFPGIGNAHWGGRPLVEVLEHFGVEATAAAVELAFEGADAYRTTIPITDLSDRELWLAWTMNDAPLPPDHGYPVRLLVPGRYGIKNPKWITRLTFESEPSLGFWESNGWSNEATYRPVSYFLLPLATTTLVPGVVPTAGAAFCGESRITSIEVSSDGGESWIDATITYEGPQGTWTLFHYDFTPAGPGVYELLSRVTTDDGRATDPDYALDYGGYTGYGTLRVSISG